MGNIDKSIQFKVWLKLNINFSDTKYIVSNPTLTNEMTANAVEYILDTQRNKRVRIKEEAHAFR